MRTRRRRTAKTMLRTKYLGDVHTRTEQGIHQMCRAHHRCLVCHHSDTIAIANHPGKVTHLKVEVTTHAQEQFLSTHLQTRVWSRCGLCVARNKN